MGFYQQLQSATLPSQQLILTSPVVHACRQRTLTENVYIAFLTQAYYYASYTASLLMAAGSRLPPHQTWLRRAISDYIQVEYGHKAWIINDILACGGETAFLHRHAPPRHTDLMAAYLYEQIQHNPMSIFGLVHVLEGSDMHIAPELAEQVESELGLPASAMTYLRSHRASNDAHLSFFATLMDNIRDGGDKHAIIHTAHVVYPLYSNMLHSLTEH
ncbi:iron-containing redox enzyme family protein [Dickeya lacustris]|uniref:Iron-containing redox enzyme family protein n=1 Tax=Dickeya lacustris TaxID=2259638 RepID=A0ABY8G2Y1_9GAMM|nr:iron-containing redox enzyme family protein [Dickeya lacustris]WFN54293.1 iron-containing redox enzyme family protein [Dickeya lacustris]